MLMVGSAAIGGTLQYGYNLAIMNAPTVVSVSCPIVYVVCLLHHIYYCCWIVITPSNVRTLFL